MNKKIKWIIFDVGGTIIYPTLINPKGYKVHDQLISQKEIESLYYTEEYEQYMLGYLTHYDFIKKFLKDKKLNISVSEFDDLLKTDITPIKGMKELIMNLAKTYKIALATNEGNLFCKYKIDGSKVRKYVSKIITSWELHIVKPSLPFFERTLDILDARPEECIFIDDVEDNVLAAKKLGTKTILFTNKKNLLGELQILNLI